NVNARYVTWQVIDLAPIVVCRIVEAGADVMHVHRHVVARVIQLGAAHDEIQRQLSYFVDYRPRKTSQSVTLTKRVHSPPEGQKSEVHHPASDRIAQLAQSPARQRESEADWRNVGTGDLAA